MFNHVRSFASELLANVLHPAPDDYFWKKTTIPLDDLYQRFVKHSVSITIVTEQAPGWILREIAEQYAKHLPNTTVDTQPNPSATINFYVNYALFSNPTTLDVGFFTHREESGHFKNDFDQNARTMDWCIAMSKKTARYLPPLKTTVIHVAPHPRYRKEPIVIGIVARRYTKSGRKREEWINRLTKIPGIEIKFTDGNIPWSQMPQFYQSIDYLLNISKNEGGPVPVLEALAQGIPVISNDVGFVSDYTTIRYNSYQQLESVLRRLVIPSNAWEISSAHLLQAFKKLLVKKNYLPS